MNKIQNFHRRRYSKLLTIKEDIRKLEDIEIETFQNEAQGRPVSSFG